MKPREFFVPQFTMETCGISCLQMVLRYFNADEGKFRSRLDARRRQERLKDRYCLPPTPGLPQYAGTIGSAIAYALFQKGLDVTLAHASPRLLENYGDYFDERHYRAFCAAHLSYIARAEQLKLQYAQAAIENGSLHLQPSGSFKVERGASVACDRLRSELDRGHLVIVQILVDGNADGLHERVMHWILLYGTQGDTFLTMDPLTGPGTKTAEELTSQMHTPFGGTFISAGRGK